MAAKWYERSPIYVLRCRVEKELGAKLSPTRLDHGEECATTFWSRVEGAGLLKEALNLYDRLATEQHAATKVRRETKKEFERRIEREGRAAEAERTRAELRRLGLPERVVQERLVQRMQPRDGHPTRAWPTPDSWAEGRLFRSKAEHNRLRELVDQDDDEEPEATEARWRIECAKRRQEERRALALARQRLRALTEAARTTSRPGRRRAV
jgi:hypothetical protein